MTTDSLTASPRQRNCVCAHDKLSYLFLLSIQYFQKQSDSEAVVFINQLRVLFGLSYAACHIGNIVEENWPNCQKYVSRFIQYSQGDFRQHWGTMLLLSQTLASLVFTAVENFRRTNYPALYHNFIHALGKVLSNPSVTQANKTEEVEQLLQTLQQHP
jgi:hypothetical protein